MTFQHGIQAEVILDSVAPDDTRLTTFLVTYNRFIIAEVDTHRKFSRVSASSRAISFETMLQRAIDHPAPFVEYPREQRGMSGGSMLEGDDLQDALTTLRNIQVATISELQAYIDRHPDKSTRLHKSLLNRTLEWFGWTTTIISSTEWDNFWRQRAHEDAQPEFRELAYAMRAAFDASEPRPVDWWSWHVPMVGDRFNEDDPSLALIDAIRVSAGRCARTSYLTHDGRRDIGDDIRLYEETLAKKGHWSPMEHQAICIPTMKRHIHAGNFDRPWHQWRHMVERANSPDFQLLRYDALDLGRLPS